MALMSKIKATCTESYVSDWLRKSLSAEVQKIIILMCKKLKAVFQHLFVLDELLFCKLNAKCNNFQLISS